PVMSGPDLQSSLGLYHGATNAREYTETILLGTTTKIVIKGGSWPEAAVSPDLSQYSTHPYDAASEMNAKSGTGSMRIGFRCACSATP
ncbi:MAG: hypothetical protein AB7N71_05130, partial [Phycisphaerae bacterium]